ncbi:DivIVA domain-containing protein [Dermatophilaceae bacterium Soc4.6]
MTWFVATLAVVLIVITTAAVLGRVDGSIAEVTSSLGHDPLPDGPLTAADLDELRFDTGLRGYRMAQVDRVVDRLRHEIVVLEQEVDRLRETDHEPPQPDHQEEHA